MGKRVHRSRRVAGRLGRGCHAGWVRPRSRPQGCKGRPTTAAVPAASGDGRVPSPIQRSSRRAVTESLAPTRNTSLTWGDAWPEVEIKVRRILRSRGAPSFTVDDALQTAAERSLLRTDGFDTLQGWINWTVKVAWHEVQAQWRREARTVLGDPADAPAGPDTEYVVEHQLELEATIRGLVTLTPPDRDAIMSGLAQGQFSVPLAAREKMSRYRARRRLAAIVADWDNEHGS